MPENNTAPNTSPLSATKQVLLEKYMQGKFALSTKAISIIPKRTQEQNIPLSLGQQQMWLLSRLVPDMPVYNECITIYLPGVVNIHALEHSFNELIRRHEAWRTTFPLVDDSPIQMIHAITHITIKQVDLRHIPDAAREQEALRIATEQTLLPFDLAHGPLLRPLLVCLSEQDHRLFLTLHHSIFDGVTLYQILLPELYALYEAYVSGQTAPLPPLPIQYADFALWQRKMVEGTQFHNQLAYWIKQLAEASFVLELPTDYPRPLAKSYRGARRFFALPAHLTTALKVMSQREGVTLFMLLYAVVNTLLYRYSGQEDILIGTVSAGRNYIEQQRLMGYFANSLVLRTQLQDTLSFRTLLKRVREVTLDAYAHQDVPFEYLVRELQPQRETGRNPLFQILLVLEPQQSSLPAHWMLTHTDISTNTSKFDLFFEFEDHTHELACWLEYSIDLFKEATIIRMISHLLKLFESIVQDSSQCIGNLSLLPLVEREYLLTLWNATHVESVHHKTCIHQLFEAQVERTPDQIALVFDGQQISYHELNQRANQLAHTLQQMGVKPEVLVGVCMERSPEMVIALLGILKAGGAYVPLDPDYPLERLAFMSQDACVSVVITQAGMFERLSMQAIRHLSFDNDCELISLASIENPVCQVLAENLAYVIYTSGSTGQPKGVAIAHRNTVSFIDWATSVFTKEELRGVLAATSICFDLSVFEIFVPLSCGGTIFLAKNILDLLNDTFSSSITLLNTVPSVMTELVRGHRIPASVCTINLAGEALPLSLVQQLYRENTVQRIYNLYGPTEATTYATYALIERDAKAITIGHPIANTQVYILDTSLQPVPIGVIGEIYIGGGGLARGYLNRPELTDERFIRNPFFQHSSTAHLYKTGDLACYQPDGTIKFLGRIDHQVKIRGFRIELEEIEEVLRQHQDVHDVFVTAQEYEAMDRPLVAYVVPVQEKKLVWKMLRRFLEERVPEYMIPTRFVLLDALPRTSNGKINRQALPALPPSQDLDEVTFAAPMLAVHYQLLQIWQELLGKEVGIRDNFFLSGGHSLLAVQLLTRIEAVFGKKLSLATLFAKPTIELLADILLEQEVNELFLPVVHVQTQGTLQPFFFLHGDYQNGPFYCIPLARDLGKERPFHALQPYRFDNLLVPPSFEEIAAWHVSSIRSVQPHGPYLLGGFCGGGLVAYEVARQLHALGESIEALVLIDPTPVASLRSICTLIRTIGTLGQLKQEQQVVCLLWLRHLYRYVQHLYRYTRFPRYRKLQNQQEIEQAKQQGRGILALKSQHELWLSYGRKSHVEQVHTGVQHQGKNGIFPLPKLGHLFPDALYPGIKALYYDWEGIFFWAASAYVPTFYPGCTTIILSEEEQRQRTLWKSAGYDKEVIFHIISSSHDALKTTHLHEMAERLRACLDKNTHEYVS